MRPWTIWTFALVFIVAVLVRLPGLDRLLDGSEVDYVRAARRGFLTNYLDIGTRPVWEFVATGLAMAGSHAAQMLGFYLPETRFVRVIDEPRSVRDAADALRRGAFRFVVIDVAADELGEGAPPAMGNNYRRLFEIEGSADTEGFEVWRRRE